MLVLKEEACVKAMTSQENVPEEDIDTRSNSTEVDVDPGIYILWGWSIMLLLLEGKEVLLGIENPTAHPSR